MSQPKARSLTRNPSTQWERLVEDNLSSLGSPPSLRRSTIFRNNNSTVIKSSTNNSKCDGTISTEKVKKHGDVQQTDANKATTASSENGRNAITVKEKPVRRCDLKEPISDHDASSIKENIESAMVKENINIENCSYTRESTDESLQSSFDEVNNNKEDTQVQVNLSPSCNLAVDSEFVLKNRIKTQNDPSFTTGEGFLNIEYEIEKKSSILSHNDLKKDGKEIHPLCYPNLSPRKLQKGSNDHQQYQLKCLDLSKCIDGDGSKCKNGNRLSNHRSPPRKVDTWDTIRLKLCMNKRSKRLSKNNSLENGKTSFSDGEIEMHRTGHNVEKRRIKHRRSHGSAYKADGTSVYLNRGDKNDYKSNSHVRKQRHNSNEGASITNKQITVPVRRELNETIDIKRSHQLGPKFCSDRFERDPPIIKARNKMERLLSRRNIAEETTKRVWSHHNSQLLPSSCNRKLRKQFLDDTCINTSNITSDLISKVIALPRRSKSLSDVLVKSRTHFIKIKHHHTLLESGNEEQIARKRFRKRLERRSYELARRLEMVRLKNTRKGTNIINKNTEIHSLTAKNYTGVLSCNAPHSKLNSHLKEKGDGDSSQLKPDHLNDLDATFLSLKPSNTATTTSLVTNMIGHNHTNSDTSAPSNRMIIAHSKDSHELRSHDRRSDGDVEETNALIPKFTESLSDEDLNHYDGCQSDTECKTAPDNEGKFELSNYKTKHLLFNSNFKINNACLNYINNGKLVRNGYSKSRENSRIIDHTANANDIPSKPSSYLKKVIDTFGNLTSNFHLHEYKAFRMMGDNNNLFPFQITLSLRKLKINLMRDILHRNRISEKYEGDYVNRIQSLNYDFYIHNHNDKVFNCAGILSNKKEPEKADNHMSMCSSHSSNTSGVGFDKCIDYKCISLISLDEDGHVMRSDKSGLNGQGAIDSQITIASCLNFNDNDNDNMLHTDRSNAITITEVKKYNNNSSRNIISVFQQNLDKDDPDCFSCITRVNIMSLEYGIDNDMQFNGKNPAIEFIDNVHRVKDNSKPNNSLSSVDNKSDKSDDNGHVSFGNEVDSDAIDSVINPFPNNNCENEEEFGNSLAVEIEGRCDEPSVQLNKFNVIDFNDVIDGKKSEKSESCKIHHDSELADSGFESYISQSYKKLKSSGSDIISGFENVGPSTTWDNIIERTIEHGENKEPYYFYNSKQSSPERRKTDTGTSTGIDDTDMMTSEIPDDTMQTTPNSSLTFEDSNILREFEHFEEYSAHTSPNSTSISSDWSTCFDVITQLDGSMWKNNESNDTSLESNFLDNYSTQSSLKMEATSPVSIKNNNIDMIAEFDNNLNIKTNQLESSDLQLWEEMIHTPVSHGNSESQCSSSDITAPSELLELNEDLFLSNWADVWERQDTAPSNQHFNSTDDQGGYEIVEEVGSTVGKQTAEETGVKSNAQSTKSISSLNDAEQFKERYLIQLSTQDAQSKSNERRICNDNIQQDTLYFENDQNDANIIAFDQKIQPKFEKTEKNKDISCQDTLGLKDVRENIARSVDKPPYYDDKSVIEVDLLHWVNQNDEEVLPKPCPDEEDLSQSSLECLLEQLIQRGKVTKACIISLDKQLIASSKGAIVSSRDVTVLHNATTGRYNGLMKIELDGQVYTCFQTDDYSVLIGVCAKFTMVSKLNTHSLVAGFSSVWSQGSCLKEIKEFAQVLNARGL